MRRKGLQPMHSEHVNVTPLIDVIMCLIIFFLLCGQLAKNESADKVRLPKADAGQEMDEQRGRLILNLVPARDDAGEIIRGQRPELMVRGQPMSQEGLAFFLRNEKKEHSDLKVIVRADRQLAYEWISPVLVACAQADITNVNYSTEK